ncbi:MAG: N-acetylmuramoyl-L-alanine amidase [Lachnospiraceae bacterium]|nr:N-acetylmuramoyl-L-alanine amidase [Lachnospiraceae bacterium]
MAYKIMIDAGHGGDDPGAVHQGRREKDDNLRLALAVGEILAENGIDVEYTRTTDVYQTPFQKATLANQSGADFFISFHRNSSPMPNQYSGIETLVYDKSGIKYEMAENINGAVAELGFKNLGVKDRPGLVVLRRTKMPALLIETGFINNDADNQLFDEKFDEIANAIAHAILGTLDLETVEQDPMMDESMTMGSSIMANQDEMYMPSGEDMNMTPEMRRPGQSQRQNQQPDQSGRPNPPQWSNRPGRPVPPQDRPELFYRVQVGAYKNKEYADNLVYELDDKGFPAYLIYEDGFYKVQVGAYRNLGNAIRMEQSLRQAGYSTWITT